MAVICGTVEIEVRRTCNVAKTSHFHPGDRVRVDSAYWSADVAGRTGTVAQYPAGVTSQDGVVWVEFDVDEWKPGVVEGAEVDAGSLHHL